MFLFECWGGGGGGGGGGGCKLVHVILICGVGSKAEINN